MTTLRLATEIIPIRINFSMSAQAPDRILLLLSYTRRIYPRHPGAPRLISSEEVTIHRSKSPEETLAYGEQLGRTAQPGSVIGLVGDLGAGKTQLVRGFARGLGITERVHSPTFTLVNEYRSGRLPCYHLDLYRLETADQILGAGLETYFQSTDAVTVIEWFDKAQGQIKVSGDLRIITLSVASENERVIAYEDSRS
jgi:tRNA threonylcarbamoyladenosine biosynthesis protein TsaE